MKQVFRFRRTTLIMVGLGAFLVGLALARLDLRLHGAWVLMFGLLALATVPRKKLPGLLCVALFGMSVGVWRGGNFARLLTPYQEFNDQKVVLRVTAESDAVYNDKSQLEFDAGTATFIEPMERQVPGRFKISGFGEPAVFRGDVVQVEGKLFKTRGSRQASISFAEMKVLGRSASVLEELRRKFVAGTITALPEPHASLGLGLLIGQRTTLPDEVNDQLSAVGLTHIIAVSGYNLTIIIRAVRRKTAKQSKYQGIVLSFLLIGTFLLVTGFSASIVRAAIVSMFSLLAWYYGRTIRPLLVLLLAAAITAFWSPLYLWSDIGWYLSFLAFFGVLILAPLLVRRFWKKEPKTIMGVVLESFCAQVMTAPLVLHIFSTTSLIALLSNALIVPLVPLAMLFSLVAGLAGMFSPVLSGFLALPARILLTYMLDVVQLLSRVPHASVSRVLSLAGMICLYAVLVFVCVILWRKLPKNGKITEKDWLS